MKYNIIGWSFPDVKALHIIIEADNGKRIGKTYYKKGCFYNFMLNHGLFNGDAIELALEVWG